MVTWGLTKHFLQLLIEVIKQLDLRSIAGLLLLNCGPHPSSSCQLLQNLKTCV